MKTSQRLKNDVKQHGPAEAWDMLMYYLITHYDLYAVIRHIRWIENIMEAIVHEVEAVTP